MTNTTPSPPPGPAIKPSPSVQSTPTSTAGAKRKRGSAGKYYAVKAGYQPGVYYAWNDCLTQVTGYRGAVFQAFSTLEEANAFLTGSKLPSVPGATTSGTDPTRFYGIQRGRVPGVYTDWAKAQEQIKGFARPRYKKFSTKEEAEAFVKLGQANGASFAGNTSEIQKLPGAPGILSDISKDEQSSPIEPGDGPLPPGAEDGFDPNVLLDPKTGKVVYKTKEQKSATKTKATGPPGMLRIYTDGSSLNNGRALASAGVGVYFGPGDNRNVSEPLKGSRQTNQRAELTAILRALDIAPRHRDVTIFTDSQYAIKCVTVWYVKWQRNKWLTSDNKPVENKDLVESIRVKIEERDELKVKTRLAVNGAQRGVSEKAAALEAIKNIPDEVFDDDI
ncbi:ribonuclease H-like domain-containing protein [Aspergillus caelatus]|uniref:ribonuclease H n=1 Tax=Aspergillus caelatus TaxID=61420 RepID=A0A5N7A6J5_9EURO|nr:ribonuclease H-like domain-containing protein [Aspergillus caelatus]KAE8365481.1 ribonuclease H-like domain-containing protein [Aspergillus caelatus]